MSEDALAAGRPAVAGAFRLTLAGQAVELLPQRAAWLPGCRWLLVADVHLGKAHGFRRLGVPVPAGSSAASLARLSALADALRPDRLVVLGDLLHGPASQDRNLVDRLARWRHGLSAMEVLLVRGNHDDAAGDPPAACGIEVVAGPLRAGGLLLCHDPAEAEPAAAGADADVHALAGHLHPQLRLRGAVDSLRLPCFWVREHVTVLPAFGDFTGGITLRPEDGGRRYLSDGQAVLPVPSVPSRARRHRR